MTEESSRLDEARERSIPWRKWGPYLSERQWGTVREDYSLDGNAWGYFSHDQARSRAYRWGEDGIGGISDDKQFLCFALALWNGNDPILKERMFGLTNAEGNHGEDVKEYYFYLDSTPTHSYMKFLYKYPQAAFPYDDLVKTNHERSRAALEYELIDTGVFDNDRYFDVQVEYAKQTPEDLLIKISVTNRGPQQAALHVLPTIWFRNTWSWNEGAAKPHLKASIESLPNMSAIAASHAEFGEYVLACEGKIPLLFTENETNRERIFGSANASPYVKDSINSYVVHGQIDAVNPARTGTKAAADYKLEVPAGQTKVVRLRLAAGATANGPDPFGRGFDDLIAKRKSEADKFYQSITPPSVNEDKVNVMRQALAGMLWSKQFFYYDVSAWIKEHFPNSPRSAADNLRNGDWFHMLNADVISMPDKWEYPWYAAWDLAFHCIPLAMVDPDFAKHQLQLVLREHYLHPNGQIPAYEWNFGDVNPPVHAWAMLYVYNIDKVRRGEGDIQFLKSAFQKLLLNFTWWVNRKDRTGKNVFEGGFLGLDNIGVFDRSSPLPTGGCLEQADGTAWMAFYSQCMLEIALELSLHDSSYEDFAMKFMEHFLWIGAAMDRLGEHDDEMWDEQDGFFYDVLRLPDGTAVRLRVRSMVGLLPLCATTVISPEMVERLPALVQRARTFLQRHPEVLATIAPPNRPGVHGRRLFGLLDDHKLRRILARMLDEKEFLSPFGLRSLSRCHAEDPYIYSYEGQEFRVDYAPAESSSGMFGGNSNWRGPVWMPVNILVLRALLKLYAYYGDDFKVECPTGSGKLMTLYEVAHDIGERLTALFTRDRNGRRPVFGGTEIFQTNAHWRDHLLFYEYFHGDNGAGLGANHQTGWTGAVAIIIQFHDSVTSEMIQSGQISARPYERELVNTV
jgi:hypothetical protein